MSILDKLIKKKNKDKKEAKKTKKIPAKEASHSKKRKVVSGGEPLNIPKSGVKKKAGFYVGALVKPHVTEKATDLSGQGKHVFEVMPGSNKTEIKKAVRNIYNVKVDNVRIVNIPRKRKRLGLTQGFKSGQKKAIVSLSKGEKIEILPR